MTRLTIFAIFYLLSSFLVLKMDLLFLNAIVKVTLKLFYTICLVLCHIAPPDAENLMNLPSTRSMLPTGHTFKKFLKPL